jgi:hypothetical protein
MDDIMMSDFLGPLDMNVEFEHDYPRIPTTTALFGTNEAGTGVGLHERREI